LPLRGRRETLGAELQKHAGKTLNLPGEKSFERGNKGRIGKTSLRILQILLQILDVSTKSLQCK
jgi:hypothetical protein